MKTLLIGGNRFVGLRLSKLLAADADCELHVLNRSGAVPGVEKAVLHKGNRDDLGATGLDREWDVVVDFSCYNYAQAKGAVEFFKDVGRFIHISTGSVYGPGRSQSETGYDPKTWVQHETPTDEEKKDPYQFGKRQAEAALFQEARFPVLSVRIPFIAGPDDYTRRFAFHVERVQKGLPIYFPNLSARTSLANAEDVAEFLRWSLRRDLTGPINVASPQDIALSELVALIEAKVGRKANLAPQEADGTHSPYGFDETRSFDVGRLLSLGFTPRPLDAWVPGLIDFYRS